MPSISSKDFLSGLKSLVHLDIDAIHAYEQALEKIDVAEVSQRLGEFRADHQRHVDELSAVIRRHGGEPPESSRDFKGFLIEGFTALRSVTGTEGALKAMHLNEKLTNSRYDRALSLALPPDARMIVEKNRSDERRHLEYIESAIRAKVWEKKVA